MTNPNIYNPLFFSLEMNVEDTAALLGYSRKKLTDLLDDKTIFSRSEFGKHKPMIVTFKDVEDDRRIPLSEIHAYLKENEIDNKEKKLNLLLEYMERTSRAIVGELETSKMPHPLSWNVDFLSLNNEYEKLKKENEEQKAYIEDNKKSTNTNREKYIEIAMSEIINIIKEVEKNKAEGKHDKSKLITQELFLEQLNAKKDCPASGKNVAIKIFKTLPKGEYRRPCGY